MFMKDNTPKPREHPRSQYHGEGHRVANADDKVFDPENKRAKREGSSLDTHAWLLPFHNIRQLWVIWLE